MYRFGACQLDPATRELRRDGQPVHLEPQAFDLLVLLVEQRDRVVANRDLLDGVWGHRFLSESNITTRIKEVRRALGDDGRTQHTVRNVRGRGYRFTAEVSVATERPERAAPTGGLIGRDAEAARVAGLLASAPVITLTGPGGVGKTALARRVAADAGSSFALGARVVELAALAGEREVLPAIARALDVVVADDHPDAAVRTLATLDALLVLDNCEHLADAVASTVDALFALAPARLRVLATARVRLGLGAEVVVPVAPLESEAARALFLARAHATHPVHDLAPHEELVGDIVEALDRVPLMIEMAAAMVPTMSLPELHAILRDGGPLLQVTHRAPARRHRTLESVTAWSADLLDEPLRRTFVDLTVFSGPVLAEDAAAVVAATDATAAIALAALAERSLLTPEPGPDGTRYRMLSTVRAVVARWSATSGREDEVRARHARHLEAVLQEIDVGWRTPDEPRARRRLDALVDDVRVAHAWARRHDPALAARMSGSLCLATYSSLWHEPVAWSTALLDAHPGRDDLLGAELVLAAEAAHRGELTRARARAERLARAEDDRIRAGALEVLSDLCLYEGDLDGVRECAGPLRSLAAALDDRHLEAFAVVNAGLATAYGGHPRRALDALGALREREPELSPSDAAWVAYALGEVHGLLGEADLAVAALTRAIAAADGGSNRFAASVARTSLAMTLHRSGDTPGALAVFADALEGCLRHGNVVHGVTTLRNLAIVLSDIGDAGGAAELVAAAAASGRPTYGAEAERLAEVVAPLGLHAGAGALGPVEPDDALRRGVESIARHRG